jgi:hypothetical protein
MAKYLCRSCPRCNGYLGVVLREPVHSTGFQTVNGHCLGCGYQLAWIVIRGRRASAATKRRGAQSVERVAEGLRSPGRDVTK